MRWEGQRIEQEAPDALPGLARLSNLVRSVTTPDFAGVTFHEVVAKSALNRVPDGAPQPFRWTINPYRGCTHACVYCFARASHRYLDLDSGADFDSQVIVKTNIVEVLRRELRRPSWGRDLVALGTNTDPYQRAEGRYQLMPGIVRALADHGTPLSVLTKGTLLRRDLPLLADVAREVPVDLGISLALVDPELQSTLEPGTPSPAARLDTMRIAADAGVPVFVLLMPVLPYLTDSHEQLDEALARIKAAGARSVSYTALHLRPGVKEWFARWLNTHRPDLTPRYRALYGSGSYASKEYRATLAARIKPLIQSHGLAPSEERFGGAEGDVARAGAARVNARDADGEWRVRQRASASPGGDVGAPRGEARGEHRGEPRGEPRGDHAGARRDDHEGARRGGGADAAAGHPQPLF